MTARVGATSFATAMWPREGRFLVPIKTAVQRAERLDVGDLVSGAVDLRATRR